MGCRHGLGMPSNLGTRQGEHIDAPLSIILIIGGFCCSVVNGFELLSHSLFQAEDFRAFSKHQGNLSFHSNKVRKEEILSVCG